MASEREDYQISIGLDASAVGEGLGELPGMLGQIQSIVDQTALGSLTAFRGKGAELGRAVLAGFRAELTGPTDLARNILSQLDIDPSKVERQAERYVGALERIRRVAIESGIPVATSPQIETGASILGLKALENQGARAHRQLLDVNAQLRLLGQQMKGLSGVSIPTSTLYRRNAQGDYQLTQSAQRAAQALGTQPQLALDSRGRVDQAAARNALAQAQAQGVATIQAQMSRLRLEQASLRAGQVYRAPMAITSQPGLASAQESARANAEQARNLARENRVIERWERLLSRIEQRTGQRAIDPVGSIGAIEGGRVQFGSPMFQSPGQRYVASRADVERDLRGPTRAEEAAARQSYQQYLDGQRRAAVDATNGFLVSKEVRQARELSAESMARLTGMPATQFAELRKMRSIDEDSFFHPNRAQRITDPRYMSGDLRAWLERNPIANYSPDRNYNRSGGFADTARQAIPESMLPIALPSREMIEARRQAEAAFRTQTDQLAQQRRATADLEQRAQIAARATQPFVGTTTGVLGRAPLAITGAQMPTSLVPYGTPTGYRGSFAMPATPEDLAREAARRAYASRVAPYFEEPQRPPRDIGMLTRVFTSTAATDNVRSGGPTADERMGFANKLFAATKGNVADTAEGLKGLGLSAAEAKAYAQAAQQAAGAQARATAATNAANQAQETLAASTSKAAAATNAETAATNANAGAKAKSASAETQAAGGGGAKPPRGGMPLGAGFGEEPKDPFERMARNSRVFGVNYTAEELRGFADRGRDSNLGSRTMSSKAYESFVDPYDLAYKGDLENAKARQKYEREQLLMRRSAQGDFQNSGAAWDQRLMASFRGAPGSGSSFGKEFGIGFMGASDRGIGEQLGQTAKFSLFYGTAYKALFLLSQGFSLAAKGAIDFEAGLTDLNIVTDRSRSSNEKYADSLSEIGSNMGLAPSATLNAGVQAIGLFDLADLPKNDQRRQQTEVTKVAARIASLSGTDVSTTAMQLAGTMRAFQLPNEDASRLEDVITYIGRRSGRPGADILQSLGLIGNLAGSAGFDKETTAAIVARLTSSTGQTPTTAAGSFRQILTKADDPATLAAMRALGVNTEGTTLAEQIQQLAGMNLSQGQQNQIIQKFGRGNAGQALGIILDQMPQIQNLAQGARGASGVGEDAFNKSMQNIGAQLRILGGHVQQLLKDLATSGLLDILAAVVKVLDLGVQAADFFVDTFNLIPHSLRTAAFAVGELTLALVLLSRMGLPVSNVLAGIVSMLSGPGGIPTRGAFGRAGARFAAGRAAAEAGASVAGSAVAGAATRGTAAAAGGGLLASLFGRGRVFVASPDGTLRATSALGATGAGQAFTAARTATAATANAAASNVAMMAAMAGSQFTGAFRRAGGGIRDLFRRTPDIPPTPTARLTPSAVRPPAPTPRPAFPGGATQVSQFRRGLVPDMLTGAPTPALGSAADAAAQRRAINLAASEAGERAMTTALAATTVTDLARRVPGVLARVPGAAATTAATQAATTAAAGKTVAAMMAEKGVVSGAATGAGAAGAATISATMAKLFPTLRTVGSTVIKGLLGPVGVALALGGGALDAIGQNRKADETFRSAQRAASGATTPEELRAAASAQAQAQKEAQKQQDFFSFRSILTLGIAPLYNKLGFSDSSNRVDMARSNRKALEAQADALEQAKKDAQAMSPELSFDNFSSADSVASGLQKLTDQGYSASQRLDLLNRAFDSLISKSGQAAGTVGVLFPGQGAEFSAAVGGAAGKARASFIERLRMQQNSNVLTADKPWWAGGPTAFGELLTDPRGLIRDTMNRPADQQAGDLADLLEKQDVTKLQSKVGQRALSTLVGRGKDPSKGLVTLSSDDVAALQTATAKELQGLIGPKTWATMTPEQQKMLTQEFVTEFRTTMTGFGGQPTNASEMQGFLAGAQQDAGAAGQERALRSGDSLLGAQTTLAALRRAQASGTAALAQMKDPKEREEAARHLANNELAILEAEQKEAESQNNRIQSLLALQNAKLGLDDKVGRGRNTLQGLRDQLSHTTDADQKNQLNAQILEQAQQNALDDISARGANRLAGIDPRRARDRLTDQLRTLQETAGRLSPGSEATGQNLDQQNQIVAQIREYDLAGQTLFAQAKAGPADSRAQSKAALDDAKRRLKDAQAGGDPNAINQALINLNQTRFGDEQLKNQTNVAARAARITPGDTVQAARDAVNNAKDDMRLYAKGTLEYNRALANYKQAQQGLSDALLAQRQTLRLLSIDMTNPVAMAQKAIKDAQDKLKAADTPEERANAQVELRSAQAGGEAAAFSQRLQDVQFAESMGRISHQAYLQYLQSEHDRLTSRLAGMKQTDNGYRQAIDELQQIDSVMKEAADQLSGQFNLGDIKIPTVYEVRRSMQPNAGMANSLADYSTTTVNINGADIATVIAYIQKYLGSVASGVRTSAPRKV